MVTATTQGILLTSATGKQEAMAAVADGKAQYRTADGVLITDPIVAYMAWDAEREAKLVRAATAAGAASAGGAPRALTCKVSEKGGLSVYGLQARFPVTLYAGQWERLEKFMPALMACIKANEGKLSRK
jgi:hypothetical protein